MHSRNCFTSIFQVVTFLQVSGISTDQAWCSIRPIVCQLVCFTGTLWIIPKVVYKDDRVTRLLHQLAERVDKELEIRALPSSSINYSHIGNIILPVIAASKASSDLEAAIQKATLSEYTKNNVLLPVIAASKAGSDLRASSHLRKLRFSSTHGIQFDAILHHSEFSTTDYSCSRGMQISTYYNH